jgi:hypothetical protein
VIPSPQLVALHAAHHAARSDVVVIGTLLAPRTRQQPWIRWESETLLKQYAEMQAGTWLPTPRQFYTGNASVRKEHVLAAGGFDTRFSRGEDVDLAFRLQKRGLSFVFEPRANGEHIARRSFKSWVAAAHEYGRVELAMGPVWGERSLVDVKLLEFRLRNAAVRRMVRIGLGRRWVTRAMLAAGRVAAWTFAAVGLWPLARGAYTAVFELAYWRGVEDASGISWTATEGIAQDRRTADLHPRADVRR